MKPSRRLTKSLLVRLLLTFGLAALVFQLLVPREKRNELVASFSSLLSNVNRNTGEKNAEELLSAIQLKQKAGHDELNKIKSILNGLLPKDDPLESMRTDKERVFEDNVNQLEKRLLDIFLNANKEQEELMNLQKSLEKIQELYGNKEEAKNIDPSKKEELEIEESKQAEPQKKAEMENKKAAAEEPVSEEEEKLTNLMKESQLGIVTDDGVPLWSVGGGTMGLKTRDVRICQLNLVKQRGDLYCGCNSKEVHQRREETDQENSIHQHPCCRDRLRETFAWFDEEMDKRELRYLLDGGAVLGWWRSRSMKEYDDTIQVTVRLDVWGSPLFKEVLETLALQYEVCVNFESPFRVSVRNYNNLMEIYLSQLVKGVAYSSSQGIPEQPLENLYPEKSTDFMGVSTYVPNKVEPYLDVYFGKGKWRKTKLSCSEEGK
jgi:hypothetical protein